MKETLIRRQREAQRRAAQRRRDLLVLAGSLAFHALLVLSVPSFSREVDIPPVLLIELKHVSPEMKLPGPAATAPNYAPEPQGARAGILSPDLKAGQGQSGAKSAAKPEPAIKQRAQRQPTAAPVKPAVKPIPAPAKPGPTKAAPPPIPESKAPQVEQASPSVPPRNNPVQPKADPPQSPAKPGDGSGGGGKVEGTGKTDGGTGEGGSSGGGSQGPSGSGEPGPGGKPGPPGAPDSGPAMPGGTPQTQPPPEPAGPSQAELDLLDTYGAAALKRIKSQARNSEQGVRGTVVFEFEVSRKGYLLDVRIVKSSGHNNLDSDVLEAARAAFNEKHEIIPFPRDVTIDKWAFRKSIKYPLY